MTRNPKKLTRSVDDRWLGGVCGGLADYTGVDANILRLIVAVATVLGAGSLILVYIVALVIVPRADTVWTSTAPVATPPAPGPPSP